VRARARLAAAIALAAARVAAGADPGPPTAPAPEAPAAAGPAADACAAEAAPDAASIARRAEWVLRGEGSELEATLEIAREGRSPRTIPFRLWDDALGDRVLLRVLPPAAVAGAAWLKLSPVLWSYEPKEGAVQRIPRAHWGDPWLDGELSLDDVLRGSGVRDYSQALLRLEERETLEGPVRAWVIESTPRDPTTVPWARLVDWIDCPHATLVRREHYDAKNELVRTLELGDVREVAGRRYPHRWVMTAADPARASRIEVGAVRFTTEFPPGTFTTRSLQPKE